MKVGRTDQNGYAIWCPGCEMPHVLKPETWTFNDDLERPTFAPSIAVKWSRPGLPNLTICHSFVVQGTIQFFDDSTHALSGKVVELPDFPTPPPPTTA